MLETLVAIIVECIQAERSKGRLAAKWNLDGIAYLISWACQMLLITHFSTEEDFVASLLGLCICHFTHSLPSFSLPNI
jgi:hypothetical protein